MKKIENKQKKVFTPNSPQSNEVNTSTTNNNITETEESQAKKSLGGATYELI